MNWIKNILGLKKKEETQELERNNSKGRICKLCEKDIYDDDRYTKKAGMYFHKKCHNELQRESDMKF